jgi:hypothetical protein
MGSMWLSSGIAGAFEAGAIALVIGAIVCAIAHHFGRRVAWNPGTEIGVAFLITFVVAGGIDAWDLFHLSIIRLESPFVIEKTLADIHDPGMLGTRVVFEFAGTIAGVLIGWYAASRGRNVGD